MKKIILFTRKLQTGGVQTALLETIKLLKKNNHNVTLITTDANGDLFKKFESLCTIVDFKNYLSKKEVSRKNLINNIKNFKFLNSLKLLFSIIFEKLFISDCNRQKRFAKRLPKLHEEYDYAIAYDVPYCFSSFYVINNLNAKNKYIWIHNDVLLTKDQNVTDYDSVFKQFTKVICVSKSAETSFLSRHPALQGKTDVVYNPIDINRVIQLSKENTDLDNNKKIKLCTVGRLDKAKGYDLAIKSCKILKDKGHDILWYVCGEGHDRQKLSELIKENNLTEDFILLGNQPNPYKYINSANIYVQTSIYESYCITLAEAKILKKPIVTTNFPCAYEHITDGENGLVCNMDENSIALSIEKLINGYKLNLEDNKHAIDNEKLINLFS